MLTIDISDIHTHFQVLQKIGNLGPGMEHGFLRAPWSDEESAAFEYFAQAGKEAGFETEYDAVGNLFLRVSGKSEKTIQAGSHLDTVPKGGLFDGGAGIVAGFEAIRAVQKELGTPDTTLELVIWRGEEAATFGSVYMGSSAAFGIADPEILSLSYKGKTLEEAITSQGFSCEPIKNSSPTISRKKLDSVIAHFELHIEQATRLESGNFDIGIVTSIRSSRRFRVIIRGQSAHSGATPMGTAFRKDAVLAFAYMHTRLNEALTRENNSGADLVQTVGIINNHKVTNEEFPEIFDASITKISELCYFFLDIRSNKTSELNRYQETALAILRKTAEEFSTRIEIQQISFGDPIESLDAHLQHLLATSCTELGYTVTSLPSGGGHDAGIVSKQKKSDGSTIPAAMIFIPCRNGISHNPMEYTSDEAVQKGAMVLANTILSMQQA
jgi:hydantoinase/carbamoylase family amidase